MDKANKFQKLETIGGILLFTSALLALLLSNSPAAPYYQEALTTQVAIIIGTFTLNKPLIVWVNEGLMTIYFFLIGLEIKREIKRGILSNFTSIIVPLVAALFGLICPAIIFLLLNYDNNIHWYGWAIPTATDIAFSLGILSLLGTRIPISLKLLLTTIAIFDDIAAIIIIAVFYSGKLSLLSLSTATMAITILALLNIFNCKKGSIFVFVGICLWLAVLHSGVHATLAGIILAMAIPDNREESLLSRLLHGLHPWVVFLILPLFAFTNAGVTLIEVTTEQLGNTLFLGIILGLFLGKQLGIFLPLWYFYRYKFYLAYENITAQHLYGLALLCGVGFTMSLFIGSLAFKQEHPALMSLVKMGVLGGSFISGTLGYLILRSLKPQATTSPLS